MNKVKIYCDNRILLFEGEINYLPRVGECINFESLQRYVILEITHKIHNDGNFALINVTPFQFSQNLAT